ncbi:MAG: nitroreductase family protein [Spirochaetales bacterium]|nr:nitroreductase family protein [Spirochaetales bacterium]
MIDLLLKRRSTRKFTSQNIETDKKEKLIQAALLSPTARNLHSCEIIVIEDKKMLEKLAVSKPHGGTFLSNAPMGIVIIGNTNKTDVWVEDASIAAIDVQLEAESLGLGSCWIQIRGRNYSENKSAGEYIKELLNIPSYYDVASIIAIGYKASTSVDSSLKDIDRSRVHLENF